MCYNKDIQITTLVGYIMTHHNLSDSIMLEHWEEFKGIVLRVKEIAELARKDYRRKNKDITSIVIVRPIKNILALFSRITNYRNSESKLVELMTELIQRLNLLATDIENYVKNHLVEELRSLATTLMRMMSAEAQVQLVLFEVTPYIMPTNRPVRFQCFRDWLLNIPSSIRYATRFKVPPLQVYQFSIPLIMR